MVVYYLHDCVFGGNGSSKIYNMKNQKRSWRFRDKYPALLLIAMALSFCARGQIDTTKQLQTINAYGYSNINGEYRGYLIVPKDTVKLRYSDSGAIAWKGNKFWQWNGTIWGIAGTDVRILNDSTIEIDGVPISVGGVVNPVVNLSSTYYPDSITIKANGQSAIIPVVSDTAIGLVTPAQRAAWDDKPDNVVSSGSITGNGVAQPLRLFNDVDFPGSNMIYSTDAAGTKGWYPDTLTGGSGGNAEVVKISIATLMGSTGLDTSKIYFITDSLKWGYFKCIGVAANKNTNNGGTEIVTDDLYRYRRIFNGPVNLYWFGGIANGSFDGGTDNAPALKSAIAAVPAGTTIEISPGSYKFDTTILWPKDKRVNLISYGDLYFGDSTGFIIDNTSGINFSSYGRILGRKQDPINYSGLKNNGVWIRNSRNNVIELNRIEGFKNAIMYGGYATGSNPADGSQYNKISWNWLLWNETGIRIQPTGGTSNSNGNWANEAAWYGGEITGDTGIAFRRDPLRPSSGDRVNGHRFYDVGFEYRGGGQPMKAAIVGEYASNNNFFGGRIEPNGVDVKFLLSNNVDGFGWYGWYMQDAWMHDMGNGATVTGSIYSNSGLLIGNAAFGYPYQSGNYFNGRIRVLGTKRSPTAAGELASNIDVDWKVETDAGTTSATYTVPPGLEMVKLNYSGGTQVTTLPPAATNHNRPVIIKNLNGSNSVTVTVASGSIVGNATVAPSQTKVFYSDGLEWFMVGSTGNDVSGSGFVKAASGALSTQSQINIADINATGGTSASYLQKNGTWSTPSGSGSGWDYIRPAAALDVSPINNKLENYNGFLYWTLLNIRQRLLTENNVITVYGKKFPDIPLTSFARTGGSAGQIPRVSLAADTIEWVNPKYDIPLQGNANNYEISNTASATTLFSNPVGSTSAIPVTNGSVIKFKSHGYVYTGSGSKSIAFVVAFGGYTVSTSATIPGSLAGEFYEIEAEINVNGTSQRYLFKFTLYKADGTTLTKALSGATTGWNNTGTLGATVQWGEASSSNKFVTNAAYFEVFRK